MKILVIDTAGRLCSVMLWQDGQVVASRSTDLRQGHAAALAPMVAAVLQDAQTSAIDCDRFAVTTGPGSFTGLRVGVSMARGLATATAKPAVGINSFRAWASTAVAGETEPPDAVLVALDSRRGTAFVQAYEGDGVTLHGSATELSTEQLADLTQKMRIDGDLRVTGDIELPSGQQAGPDLSCVAKLAAYEVVGKSPSPFYLRPPDAKPITTIKP